MESIESLRLYEANTLRPRWDNLRAKAEAKAGVLNWESAPAEAWDQPDAESYHNMVFKWAIQVQRALETADPEGKLTTPELTSLRTTFRFHVEKIVFLRDLGVSLPPVPTDLKAILNGIGNAFTEGPRPPGEWPWWVWAILAGLGVAALGLGTMLIRPRR